MCLRKILAISLPGPIKYDTVRPCLMLQAIYMWKNAGNMLVYTRIWMSVVFPGNDSFFYEILSYIAVYCCSIVQQGLWSTFDKSEVERSEKQHGLDSCFHSGILENWICRAQLNPFLFNEYSGYLKHMPVNLNTIFHSLWLLIIFLCISEYASKLLYEGSTEQLWGRITI